MKKVLTTIYPPINSFPHQGAIFSMLFAREECKPWLFSNFIQIFSLKNLNLQGVRKGTLDFFNNQYGDWKQFEFKANPWIRFNSIPEYFIEDYNINIIDFIKKNLDQEKYLYLSIDRFFIPIYKYSFMKNHSDHEIFVFGYDDETQCLYVGDNGEGKYVQSTVDYESFTKSFHSMIAMFRSNEELYYYSEKSIYILEIIKNAEVNLKSKVFVEETYNNLNIHKIVNDLKEYLLLDNFGDSYKNSDYYVFGIDCYNELQQFLVCSDEYIKIDFRAFYSFLQHKKLMLSRMNYLNNIYNVYHLSQSYEKIVKKFESIILLILKCNLKKDSSMWEKISNLLNECKTLEVSILKDLIDTLEQEL